MCFCVDVFCSCFVCVCIVFIHFSFLVMFYSCHIDVQLSHLNKDYLLTYLLIWPVWLENAYSRPQNWGFWAISTNAKKAHPCVSPRHFSH